MKIYVVHSREFDFDRELYQPIKSCPELWDKHEIILPHDNQSSGFYSQPIIKTVDAIIAEVSYPSTGMGIELGWADFIGKTIYCFHKDTHPPSSSIQSVASTIKNYKNSDELVASILAYLS